MRFFLIHRCIKREGFGVVYKLDYKLLDGNERLFCIMVNMVSVLVRGGCPIHASNDASFSVSCQYCDIKNV